MERDFDAIDRIPELTTRTQRHVRFVPNFSREPPFFLCRLSYMRDSPPERSDRYMSELAWMVAAVGYSKIAIGHLIDASAETHLDRG
jgi:hypothetical protein